MEFLIPSFLAGLLTVLAPCVIALLPVILGGNLGQKDPWRPLIIASSLGVSVLVFTLLLKATTVLIGIPREFWTYVSGALVLVFGLTMMFPSAWSNLAYKLGLYKSEKLLEKSGHKKGKWGAVLLGASLGPVFTTCSPTYAIILAVVLPANFFVGLLNLIAYALGLVLLLLLIGYGGQKVSSKFRFAVNPNGWFKRGLGVLLVLTGLMIVTGFDKTLEGWVLDAGYLGPIQIEQNLLE
ncbi:cytochrome C biogenesis protein [Candidatus Peregrinibacteria bacterium]|jgi:cytochrome c-type biogenesis protein|nr:cytochrome C biogenesis protein [Candidatus Peregrinibacteria bacterium]MBT4632235.1 cytochrome C biogenesis protein [Candidatus Peregrinibacteria bacterium]MBT5516678.1 cytochrome C biogenesis protein [Candidatus Peregrinibacteria bacterium]MBT5824354.1 cytochrome C biogenesis protein [Candidatus Peregrinibacteria bacterium]